MAFTESDRVQIRMYLGFGRLYLSSDPRLESAITTAQALIDGGSSPDNTTELLVKATIVKLQAKDAAIDALDVQQGAAMVGKIQVDSAREAVRLKAEGRRYIGIIADVLRCRPLRDYYSSVQSSGSGGGEMQRY